jgi:cation transport ATPase
MLNDTRALRNQTTNAGRQKLVTIVALDGWDDSALLALTTAVATGRTALVAGHTVALGDAALFRELGLSTDNLGDWPERLRQRGEQVVFVAVDGRTAGFLGVADAGV